MNAYSNMLTNEFLNDLIIRYWTGEAVCVDIDECLDEIQDLIIYENHGDDYVLVHADNHWYEYTIIKNSRKKAIMPNGVESGVEVVRVWYHNGVNMNVSLNVDDEYYSGVSLDDENLDRDEWGSCTWWVTPDNLVHKLALMSNVFAPDLTINARYDVVSNLRSKISALEKELAEATALFQEEIRKAHEIDPDYDYEIFGDKVVRVERKEI